MQKKLLPDLGKIQELKNQNFVSKTARALLIVILFAAVFLICQPILAQNNGLSTQGLEASGLPTVSLGVLVARIINAALGLLGLVAVLIIMYGGYMWMTARGELERVQKAKKILIQGVIGLIIIVLSFAIAQFLFFVLGINPWAGLGGGGGGGGGGGLGGGGGALGAGIIRSHYPARNAKNIPRNTKIVITFKEPVCILPPNSFIDTKVWTDPNDDISKSNMILIYPRPASASAKKDNIAPEKIKVYTTDNKTFVFKPIDPLGNDQTPTDYIVELTANLKRGDCTTPAFGKFGGYKWNFQVSTVLDLTPPKIVSVIPKPSLSTSVPRNTVVQINFNEAIDPITTAGKLVIAGGGKTGSLTSDSYNLMTVKAGADYVAGEFYFSNQYKTVEFITNDPCGKNSCGDEIFCLPGLNEISVLAKAATLTEAGKPAAKEGMGNWIYDGLVDMCSNSLDGNKNGIAEGPAGTFEMNATPPSTSGDNASWQFNTNDVIDLVPPQVKTRNPENNDPAVDQTAGLKLSFDKSLLFSSVIQHVSLTLDQSLPPVIADDQIAGYDFSFTNTNNDTESTVIINTYDGLAEEHPYNIIANSGIKDSTQNCFLPCADCPTGSTCNCKRKYMDIPGQYEPDTPWTATKPNCDLTTP